MRTKRLGSALLALFLSVSLSGCWVFDELAAGEKEMERYGNHAKKKEEDKKATTASASADTGTSSEAKWWQSATSLTPRDGSSDLVRCSNGSFTRKDDCLAAGGSVVD